MLKKFKRWYRRFQLQMGTHLLRRGAGLQPNQPIKLATAVKHGMKGHNVKQGVKTVYVENMWFNFKLNKIVYRFTHIKPKNVLKGSNDTSTEK